MKIREIPTFLLLQLYSPFPPRTRPFRGNFFVFSLKTNRRSVLGGSVTVPSWFSSQKTTTQSPASGVSSRSLRSFANSIILPQPPGRVKYQSQPNSVTLLNWSSGVSVDRFTSSALFHPRFPVPAQGKKDFARNSSNNSSGGEPVLGRSLCEGDGR